MGTEVEAERAELRGLVAQHEAGKLTLGEYRAARTRLLDSITGQSGPMPAEDASSSDTMRQVRRSAESAGNDTNANITMMAPIIPMPASRRKRWPWVVAAVLVLLVLLAAGTWYVLQQPEEVSVATVAVAENPLQQADNAAGTLVAKQAEAWSPADVGLFIASWQEVPEASRKTASHSSANINSLRRLVKARLDDPENSAADPKQRRTLVILDQLL